MEDELYRQLYAVLWDSNLDDTALMSITLRALLDVTGHPDSGISQHEAKERAIEVLKAN